VLDERRYQPREHTFAIAISSLPPKLPLCALTATRTHTNMDEEFVTAPEPRREGFRVLKPRIVIGYLAACFAVCIQELPASRASLHRTLFYRAHLLRLHSCGRKLLEVHRCFFALRGVLPDHCVQLCVAHTDCVIPAIASVTEGESGAAMANALGGIRGGKGASHSVVAAQPGTVAVFGQPQHLLKRTCLMRNYGGKSGM
jgi:hypothetical protein